MSKTLELAGKCLCGATGITAKNVAPNTGACHCSMCRRWGGGPFMTIAGGAQVEVTGGDNVSVFGSSDWAERGFCNQCGTHLFYRLKGQNDHFLPVGLFEPDDALVFEHQVFIDEKPEFYAFANKTHDMTGAEVIAQFAAPCE